MARGKKVQPAFASGRFLYNEVSEIPWRKLETTAGKKFSPKERNEIFECTNLFSVDSIQIAQAPPVKDIQEVQDCMKKHLTALKALFERFRPDDPLDQSAEGSVSPEDDNILWAMTQIYGTKDLAFREEFHAVGVACGRHLECLNSGSGIKAQPTFETPEVAGLKGFLKSVLENAQSTPARSGVTGAKEFTRWGISVGPQSKIFRQFTSTLLQRDMTMDQLRDGWKKAADDLTHDTGG